MFKKFEKRVKKMKMLDLALAKIGVAAFVLFLAGVWPGLRMFVMSVSPLYFLAISVVAVAIVQWRIWKK